MTSFYCLMNPGSILLLSFSVQCWWQYIQIMSTAISLWRNHWTAEPVEKDLESEDEVLNRCPYIRLPNLYVESSCQSISKTPFSWHKCYYLKVNSHVPVYWLNVYVVDRTFFPTLSLWPVLPAGKKTLTVFNQSFFLILPTLHFTRSFLIIFSGRQHNPVDENLIKGFWFWISLKAKCCLRTTQR